MRRSSLYCLVLLAMLLPGFFGCKKKNLNAFNNNTVVETPYTLYYTDTSGNLYSTNDGLAHKLVFPADGYPCRALCTSGLNILLAKNNLYVSTNNGVNFNHAFDSLQSVYRSSVCNSSYFNLNQSMLIDVADWNRVYTVTNIVHNPSAGIGNYLGVEYSPNHGIRGSFVTEASYDTNGRTGLLPVSMVSYSRLKNGVLAGIAINRHADVSGAVDTAHARNFYKECADCGWKETTAGTFVTGLNQADGVPLPPNTVYPDTGFFTLGHYNNRLIAIDHTCHNGAFYSDDTGRNWAKYSGLPTNVQLLCIASPFEEICLVGTFGAGLYRLNVNTQTFELNNRGLTGDLVVRNIAAKTNYYKNKTTKRFIYLATNKGIYQSTDDGNNWVLTIPGNFVAVY
ncbi:MAG: hypothetical protein JWQ38_718 [Flavipsychrobacter sp.]|nr:hypothetical protein [Flavipsychrobacter sp.]